VLVASPHSSNWDTAVMLLCAAHFGIRLRWVGKRESFRGPLGPVLRRLGGIPIERAGGRGVVASTAEVFRDGAPLALAIAPDGTRSARDYWRSGFTTSRGRRTCPGCSPDGALGAPASGTRSSTRPARSNLVAARWTRRPGGRIITTTSDRSLGGPHAWG
jgi:hypothetical protein